jgi:DNA-binding transcriptional MocR family regulator
MEQALRDVFGARVHWLQPKGGFFVWLGLPAGVDDERLLSRALEEHVAFVVGSAFYVDGSGHDRIRLSFSAPPAEQIAEGVRRLSTAMIRTGDSAPDADGRMTTLRSR